MIVNHGKWEELPDQCKQCQNIKVASVHMDGNHYYACGKYPLHDSNEVCPKFAKSEEY